MTVSRGEPVSIQLDRERLFNWLFGGLILIEVLLVLLDAVISEFEYVNIGAAQRLFNITREDGIPNFFSSFQMLATGSVLLLITMVVRRQSYGSGSRVTLGWGVVAGLFLFTGFDDATKLHERLGAIFRTLVTDSSGQAEAHLLGRLYDAFPSYTWQLVVGPFAVLLGVFALLFLLKQLPALDMRALVLAAAGLLIMAQAMDFIEGMDNDFPVRIADVFSTFPGRVVHFSKSIEEFWEMLSTTTFLYVFLRQLTTLTSSLTFEFNPRR